MFVVSSVYDLVIFVGEKLLHSNRHCNEAGAGEVFECVLGNWIDLDKKWLMNIRQGKINPKNFW